MSKDTISKADSLFIGRGYDPSLYAQRGRRGVPWHPTHLYGIGAPAAAVADYLVKAATSTELPNTETVTYTPSTDGDSPLDGDASVVSVLPFGASETVSAWAVNDGAAFGRNLAAAVTATTVAAMTITISGYDYLRRAMTETLTISAGGTSKSATGKKAWKWVTSVAITAAGNAEGNTLNLGTGSVLGLPVRLEKLGHMMNANLGGVQERISTTAASGVCAVVAADSTDPATATTGDVRGTITFNGTLDGSAEAFVLYHVSGRNTAEGLVGVDQA